jgi:hypothetical protein
MKNLVFGIASSRLQADRVLDGLKTAGLNNALSALFPDRGDIVEATRVKGPRKQRREPSRVMPRAAWWAARRHGFTSIGALTIPGVGPLVAAGPIIAALRDAAARGMAGALNSLGISGYQANRYEEKIKNGYILISVQTENSDESELANEIFMVAGAQDMCLTGEASAKDRSATEYASRPTEAAPSRTRL